MAAHHDNVTTHPGLTRQSLACSIYALRVIHNLRVASHYLRERQLERRSRASSSTGGCRSTGVVYYLRNGLDRCTFSVDSRCGGAASRCGHTNHAHFLPRGRLLPWSLCLDFAPRSFSRTACVGNFDVPIRFLVPTTSHKPALVSCADSLIEFAVEMASERCISSTLATVFELFDCLSRSGA